jgi:putative spermidine/putrescine transport system substrate-binding protein
MYRVILAVLAVFSTGILDASAADELKVLVFARENRDAMESAYFKPFGQATGVTLRDGTYDGVEDKFTRMVQSGKATWDVIQVESRMLELGCKEGWFEKLDLAKVGDKADFVPGSMSECGIGIFAWSHVFAYTAIAALGFL